VLVELVGVWSHGPGDPADPVVTAKAVTVPRGNTVVVRLRLVDQRGRVFGPARLGGTFAITLAIGHPENPTKRFTFAPNPAYGSNTFDVTLQNTDLRGLSGLMLYDVWATWTPPVPKSGPSAGVQPPNVVQQVVQTSHWNNQIRVLNA
jgi:hypothetical protein